MFRAIRDFLFGKDANIFDSSGRVRHQFPEAKWKQWDARFKDNPEYDWRQHSGREKAEKSQKSTQTVK